MNIYEIVNAIKGIAPDFRYLTYEHYCEDNGITIYPLSLFTSTVGQYVVISSTYGDIDFLDGLNSLSNAAPKPQPDAIRAGCNGCGGGKIL